MERILIDHEWYFAIGKESLLEIDFQGQLIANAASIFPDFIPVIFNLPIRSEEFGASAPDFLLFEKKLRAWWIVEAEMSRHSISGHVEPQVAALAHAKINESDAERIASKAPPDLDKDRLKALVLSVQANVLVIVDREMSNWASQLQNYDATLITIQPFRSRHGRYAFRQRGEIPGIGTTFLSTVIIRRDVTRALIIENRSALKLEQGEEVEIFIDDTPTNWRCHSMGGTMMMFCLGGRFPFETSSGIFHLVELSDQSLAIEKQTSRIVKDNL